MSGEDVRLFHKPHGVAITAGGDDGEKIDGLRAGVEVYAVATVALG